MGERTLRAKSGGILPRCALALALVAAAPALSKPKGADGDEQLRLDVPAANTKPGKPKGAGDDDQRVIKIPITINKQSDLEFGKVVMLGETGSVVVRAAGLPVYSNVVALGGSPKAARFHILGPPNMPVEINLTFPLDGRYGSRGSAKLDGLSVRAEYTTGFQQEGSIVRLKLDSSGHNTITVGGKLSLLMSTPGRMSIMFPITASVVK